MNITDERTPAGASQAHSAISAPFAENGYQAAASTDWRRAVSSADTPEMRAHMRHSLSSI
jgi:hypothetical protein